MGSTPTICAKSSNLRGAAFYFCNKLCKGCKVGFEQPVPGALRPAGQKCPGGAFLGRGCFTFYAPQLKLIQMFAYELKREFPKDSAWKFSFLFILFVFGGVSLVSAK